MKTEGNTPDEMIANCAPERQEAMRKIRSLFLENLPEGFTETISYGMISYCVPHSRYPQGYHCNPKQPLPFISFASQKNFIAIYHMGLYLESALYQWFSSEYKERVPTKLDMGKSCIRFKKMDQIPYELLAELFTKMSVSEWISAYESVLNRS
jgi:uncharacterized protein YdhG (YjbR/CyaY superfamily)